MELNGIHSMGFEQYAAASGINNSALTDILPPEETPLHFWAKNIAKIVPREETPAQRLGVLTHRFILENETTGGAFHVKPDGMMFTTKKGKAWKAEHADRPILTAEDATSINAMREAVWRHPMARRLIAGAKMEQCLFAQDDHGTLRKGRLDLLHATGTVIPDLKTCAKASEREIEKAIDQYGYYRAAAYYLDLCDLLHLDKQAFVLICVEKTPPYDVACYQIADEVVAFGRRAYNNALQIYRNCMESGKWPGRSNEITGIGLPAWRQRELENS